MACMGKRFLWLCLLVMLTTGSGGCAAAAEKNEKTQKIDFTVVKHEDFPEEIKKVIDERKQEEFQMTYQSEEELYILKGYGIQSTGGYSIQVEYVTENTDEIHIKTRLIGPSSREEQKDVISCPYLVVKIENRDKKVIFD